MAGRIAVTPVTFGTGGGDPSNSATLPTGSSTAIWHVNWLISQLAAFDSNVLIRGESGTGKEVVAPAIHYSSPRRLRLAVTGLGQYRPLMPNTSAAGRNANRRAGMDPVSSLQDCSASALRRKSDRS